MPANPCLANKTKITSHQDSSGGVDAIADPINKPPPSRSYPAAPDVGTEANASEPTVPDVRSKGENK